MEQFSHIWVPLVTPFRNGDLDLKATQSICEHVRKAGVRGVVVCGTTGEASSLTAQEQARLLTAVREVAGRSMGVLMGVSGCDTRTVAGDAERWSREPIDGLLVSTPYYVRPSQQGLVDHFKAVAAASRVPVVLYNIPYRTGVNLLPRTVAELVQLPGIVAIKESGSGDVDQLFELTQIAGLQVLSGEDTMIFVCACLGGHGAIAAAAHVRPDLFVRLWELASAGQLGEARALNAQLQPLVRALFAEPNPAPLKFALSRMGLCSEELRSPMAPMSAAGRERVLGALQTLGVL